MVCIYKQDHLLCEIEDLLKSDIEDVHRRMFVAMLIKTHVRSSMTFSLKDLFEPWIGMDAPQQATPEVLDAMRTAVIRMAGYDSSDPSEAVAPDEPLEERIDQWL